MDKEKLVKLVVEAQMGSDKALSDIYYAFYNDVYYIAERETKNHQLALDITQETFIEIIQTINKLEEPAAFVSWMKMITHHQCSRHYKKKETKHEVIVDYNEDDTSIFDTFEETNEEFLPDKAYDNQEFKETIRGFIDELPAVQRAAIMMKYFDDLSVREIAEIQGVSENTVLSRLNYGRKSIKKSVELYEEKTSVKLHAIPFIPFFKWIFDGTQQPMTVETAETIAQAISTELGKNIAISSVSATAATEAASTASTIASNVATTVAETVTGTTTTTASTTAATSTVAKIVAGITAASLKTKIVAVVVAAALAITSGVAINSHNDDNIPSPEPYIDEYQQGISDNLSSGEKSFEEQYAFLVSHDIVVTENGSFDIDLYNIGWGYHTVHCNVDITEGEINNPDGKLVDMILELNYSDCPFAPGGGNEYIAEDGSVYMPDEIDVYILDGQTGEVFGGVCSVPGYDGKSIATNEGLPHVLKTESFETAIITSYNGKTFTVRLMLLIPKEKNVVFAITKTNDLIINKNFFDSPYRVIDNNEPNPFVAKTPIDVVQKSTDFHFNLSNKDSAYFFTV